MNIWLLRFAIMSLPVLAFANDAKSSFFESLAKHRVSQDKIYNEIRNNPNFDLASLTNWCDENSFDGNFCVIQSLAELSNSKNGSIQRFVYDFLSAFKKHTATDFLRKAADNGHSDSQYEYGLLLKDKEGKKTNSLAVTYLIKAAERNSVDALYELGLIYIDGISGVKPDPFKAFEYLKKASDLGDDNATLVLGHMYLEGVGVKQSRIQAKDIYQKACDDGNELACDALIDI